MKAINLKNFGGPEVLEVIDNAIKPNITDTEVLIKVKAAGINRPDIIQRMGLYPPPPGASDILGLEVSGTIVEVGSKVDRNYMNKDVCALSVVEVTRNMQVVIFQLSCQFLKIYH